MKPFYSSDPALCAEVHKIARLEFAAQDNLERADEFHQEARLLSANLAREHWNQVKDVAFTSMVNSRTYEIVIRADGSYDFDELPF